MNQITLSWWLKKRQQRIHSAMGNEMNKNIRTDVSLLDGILGKRSEPQPTQTPQVHVNQSRHSQKTSDFAREVVKSVSGPNHKPTRDEMNRNILSSMVPKSGSGMGLRKSPFDLQ